MDNPAELADFPRVTEDVLDAFDKIYRATNHFVIEHVGRNLVDITFDPSRASWWTVVLDYLDEAGIDYDQFQVDRYITIELYF